MRYFFYILQVCDERTVIIVDGGSDVTTTFPNRGHYSKSKKDWLDYYQYIKDSNDVADGNIYEICENQFKKFAEKGVVPENWNGIWPYTRPIAVA